MIAQLGPASANYVAYTAAMKTVSSNHVVADQVFRNIASLPHLCAGFAVWFSFIQSHAALRHGVGNPVENVRMSPGMRDAAFTTVRFVTGHVSVPFCPLNWLLEAAQRRVFSGKHCAQERTVHQDHHHQQLHRRGESSPASRAGPVLGHCTRRGFYFYF